jgi:hypothetical protein
LVAGEADDIEADDRLLGAAARERSVVDEPRAADGGAAAHRSRYRDKLNKVNVVVHPITNADGAQLAYDLQKIIPTYMLLAGYLGSLGVDVTARRWGSDPIYPESGIRRRSGAPGCPTSSSTRTATRRTSGCRSSRVRRVGAHALGRDARLLDDARLVDAGFGWLDDARYPRHKDEQMKLLEMITEYAKAAPAPSRSTSAPTIATSATASTSIRRTSSSISPTAC